ncbi:MAG TPA: hypothetical protein VF118_03385, partial [Gemmatimonadaceae bacterium]
MRRLIGRAAPYVFRPILLGRAHAFVRLHFTRLHLAWLHFAWLHFAWLHVARWRRLAWLHCAGLLHHSRLLHFARLRFVLHARLGDHARAGRGLGTCNPSRCRSDRRPHDLGARLLDHRRTRRLAT